MDALHLFSCVVRKDTVSTHPLSGPQLSRPEPVRHQLPRQIVRLRARAVAVFADVLRRLEDRRVETSDCLIVPLQVVIVERLRLASAFPAPRADRCASSYARPNSRRSSCRSSTTPLAPVSSLYLLVRRSWAAPLRLGSFPAIEIARPFNAGIGMYFLEEIQQKCVLSHLVGSP